MSDDRECTCHPDEAPVPCQKQYAFTECETLRLRAENEKLRAALKPFADIAKQTEHWSGPPVSVPLYVIRAAAAALKETGE